MRIVSMILFCVVIYAQGFGQNCTITTTKTNTTCNGNSNGSITVIGNGGIGLRHYSINNGLNYQLSTTFNGLAAGTYSVVMKAGNCVSAVHLVIITSPPALTVSVAKTDITCHGTNNGIITVTASGGTGTKHYSKDNGVTYQVSNIFTTLATGSYHVLVKDANNCVSAVHQVVISSPLALAAAIVKTNITCRGTNNGSITVTASGGTGIKQYSKDNGVTYQVGNTFNGLAAGTYPVVVKDVNNCISAVQHVVISSPTVLTATVVKTDVTCNGINTGSIILTANGGTGVKQYSKDNGVHYQLSPIFNGLSAGTYPVVVKDANNCLTTVQNVIIANPPNLTATIVKTDEACNGASSGSITVTASSGKGGKQYSKTMEQVTSSVLFLTDLQQGSILY